MRLIKAGFKKGFRAIFNCFLEYVEDKMAYVNIKQNISHNGPTRHGMTNDISTQEPDEESFVFTGFVDLKKPA